MTDWENKASIAVGACENMDEVRTLIAGLMESTEILDWLSDYDHTKTIGGIHGVILHWYDNKDRRQRVEGKDLRDCVIKAMEQENER